MNFMKQKVVHIKLNLDESVDVVLHPYKIQPQPEITPEVKKDSEENLDDKDKR